MISALAVAAVLIVSAAIAWAVEVSQINRSLRLCLDDLRREVVEAKFDAAKAEDARRWAEGAPIRAAKEALQAESAAAAERRRDLIEKTRAEGKLHTIID